MKNRITTLLSCEYPLIQGSMRWITFGEMAATVSNSGGFGQIRQPDKAYQRYLNGISGYNQGGK